MKSPRELALESLIKCEKNGRYSNLELDSVLKKGELSQKDKGLYAALFYGVIERKITLDYLLGQYSARPMGKMSPRVKNLLRLGLYQIRYMDRVPDSAAVNESVKLIKKSPEASASSFINGILRTACRKKEEGFEFDAISDPIRRLSVEYAYPEWMVKLWKDAYGIHQAKEIMEEENLRAPLTVRINTLLSEKDALIRLLAGKGIIAESCEEADNALKLPEHYSLADSEELAEGLFFVQDLSSQIACGILDPQPGETVLDMCCCPGGKSFHAAIRMKNQGKIRAFDLHKSKLNLVTKGAEKLGISIIETGVNDSAKPREDLAESADRVICDVPCSGLGVIAKKPDIREKSEEEIRRLPGIQRAILETSAGYVKRGGVLLYSTCTLNPEENERVTEDFLRNHPEFSRSGEHPLPMTIFPKGNHNDGFFIDLFIKSK